MHMVLAGPLGGNENADVGNQNQKKILRAVELLPDNATIEDAIEGLYFLAKVENGIREADAGLTVPRLIGSSGPTRPSSTSKW